MCTERSPAPCTPNSQHQHQTKNTSPKQTPPKSTLKQLFRSLKALFPPHPPRPVHIVLARLPLPPPPSVCTWTRWYAAEHSYTAWLVSTLMLDERVSWVRERVAVLLNAVLGLTRGGYREFTFLPTLSPSFSFLMDAVIRFCMCRTRPIRLLIFAFKFRPLYQLSRLRAKTSPT